MFLTELTPIIKELTQQPAAFLGGFFAGAFNLNISEEPLKGWLNKQGIYPNNPVTTYPSSNNGPQSITIE